MSSSNEQDKRGGGDKRGDDGDKKEVGDEKEVDKSGVGDKRVGDRQSDDKRVGGKEEDIEMRSDRNLFTPFPPGSITGKRRRATIQVNETFDFDSTFPAITTEDESMMTDTITVDNRPTKRPKSDYCGTITIPATIHEETRIERAEMFVTYLNFLVISCLAFFKNTCCHSMGFPLGID